jgi:hypothetical protein
MPPPVLSLMRLLQRWFGWEWAVLVIALDDDVRTLKLPEDLPVSVREDTDGSVGIALGHVDDGEAPPAGWRSSTAPGARTQTPHPHGAHGARDRRAPAPRGC